MTTSSNASPRMPRQAALSNDMDYEDKHMFPPSHRSHLGSPLFSRKSASSVASSVENSPAAPSNAKSFAHSPMQSRRSEPDLLVSPRYESRKRMSADFSDDTMSVGSVGGESPKSDRGSWRLHSAVSGPFLTGPLAKDFQTEHLKTPRGKARDDMNFDHSGLLFPLAPVLDTIPDTPRGGFYQQPQGFTDISQFENSSEAMDGFHLDSTGGYASHDGARPVTAFNTTRRTPAHSQAYNSQFYAGQAVQYDASTSQQQQQFADGSVVYSAASQQQLSSSAIVATQASSNGHGPSYADVVVRNGKNNSSSSSSQEQSLVAASASDSLESLSQGMADSMAQILAKTQSGRSYGEVQLTTLVQKIHMHMTVMGRTSAAIREDYNRIKAKLEQTITDKKVLEATNYHLQQLVQQYEVERQYFHQYVLHSLQSQSSLIYESMGTLSQNVVQSKHTIEELSARLSRELSNIQGSGRSDSQLKEILEEIKRAMDASVLASAQQQQHSDVSQPQYSPARSPAAESKQPDEATKASSFKLVPVLLAVLLWIATLSGVYLAAKSAALSELQTQTQQPSPSSMLPSDLDRIVDQIAQKLETAVQASEVRKLVYSELEQNPQLVDSVALEPTTITLSDAASEKTTPGKADDGIAHPVVPVTEPATRSSDDKKPERDATSPTEPAQDAVNEADAFASKSEATVEAVAPELGASSDAAVPPAPTTTVIETEKTTEEEPIVEIAVPPAEPFAISDAAIAEMLRLNGFPSGVPPLDAAASARAGDVAPPAVDAVAVDVSVAPASERDSKAEAVSKVATSVTADDAAASATTEPNAVAPEATESDSSHDDASASAVDDVVKITIASALNPEVIAPTESPSTSANATTPAAEPAQRVDSIALDALDSLVVAPNESVATTEPVDETDDAAPSAGAVSTDASDSASEIEPPVANEDVEDEISLSTVDVDHSSSEDLRVNSVEPETVAPASDNDIEEVDVATASVENASAAKTTTHVERVATEDADDDDSSVSSVIEKLTSSAPFTGLSMALRSLAHRFVESVDVSSVSTSGSDGVAVPESLSVVSEIAHRLDEPTAADATTMTSEDAETSGTVESIVPVKSVDADADVSIEDPTAAAAVDVIIASSSEALEPALDNHDDVESTAPSSDTVDADADLVTVEVTAGGDVAAPTVQDAIEDSVASADGMDALRSFFSTLESQVAELAAQGEAVVAATTQDTTEETEKPEQSDDSAPVAADASGSEVEEAVKTTQDADESVSPPLDAVSNDTLAEATQASAAGDSDEIAVDALVTESLSADVSESISAAPVDVEVSSVAPAVDASDATTAASDATDVASVSVDEVQDASADESTITLEPLSEMSTDATELTTDAALESPAIETVDDAFSNEPATEEAADAVDVARRLASVDAVSESPVAEDSGSSVDASTAEPMETTTDASEAPSDADKSDAKSADDDTSDAAPTAQVASEASSSESAAAAETAATSVDVEEAQEPATLSAEAADAVDADVSAESTMNAIKLARDADSDGAVASADADTVVVAGTERELAAQAAVRDSVADAKTSDDADPLELPDDAVGAAAELPTRVDAIGSVSDVDSASAATSESHSPVPSSTLDTIAGAAAADATPSALEDAASASSSTDSVQDAPEASPAADATTDATALDSDSSVAVASVAKAVDDTNGLAPAFDADQDASTPLDTASAADDGDSTRATPAAEASIADVAVAGAKTATLEDVDRDL